MAVYRRKIDANMTAEGSQNMQTRFYLDKEHL